MPPVVMRGVVLVSGLAEVRYLQEQLTDVVNELPVVPKDTMHAVSRPRNHLILRDLMKRAHPRP